ncbi:hypothetical protein [Soonwooa sp.]|uniref:hypothetical protein n=1 Tax=Soonwooa sp. TaxID=1938592 RepID=UPI00260FBE23|nr:hypothetical protein [Soonwooa sp.]
MISKSLRTKLRRKKYLLKWYLQFHFGKHLSYSNLQELKLTKDSKSLVLAPHADDEWIGASQILLNTDASVFYFQFLGKNYNEANKSMRRKEIENVQKEIGFNLISAESKDDFDNLAKLIENGNFDKIFLPFPIDWHPEHIKVNDILLSLFEKYPKLQQNKLYFYQISVPFPSGLYLEYRPMSKKDLNYKIQVFSKHYISQFNTPITRMAYQLRLNAVKTKHYAVEAYASLDYKNWKKLLDYANKNYAEKLKPIAHHIDNLIDRKNIADELFQEWQSFVK